MGVSGFGFGLWFGVWGLSDLDDRLGVGIIANLVWGLGFRVQALV